MKVDGRERERWMEESVLGKGDRGQEGKVDVDV